MTSVLSLDNATFIRPSSFFINGLYNIPHAKYYYIFLCFVYVMTVLGNSAIMGTIYLAHTLHTAKYIAVFNLALCDVCGSSAVIPKYADMFLFNNQYISFEDCLANMFFVFLFMTMQSLTLLALAYDRVIAICFPLRYHDIVTKTTMVLIIGGMWFFSVSLVGLMVALITRLSFCRTTIVDSYFCDHGPIISLACNDKSPNYKMSFVYSGVVLGIPLILIAFSYVCIGLAVLKISHGIERIKALKTCTSHIVLVAMFYLPIFSTYASTIATNINPNTRIINSVLTQTIPSMLNPIVYTMKTEEVLMSIKALYKQMKLSSMDESVKGIMKN
ncbi:olfactory receptor 1E16-like [Hoplias malabaricus]|uniref:olfactory receptor 1E16-like n=1 Tax=Hoplias malabaricus TaxID=27720 RepID=UPI0034633190